MPAGSAPASGSVRAPGRRRARAPACSSSEERRRGAGRRRRAGRRRSRPGCRSAAAGVDGRDVTRRDRLAAVRADRGASAEQLDAGAAQPLGERARRRSCAGRRRRATATPSACRREGVVEAAVVDGGDDRGLPGRDPVERGEPAGAAGEHHARAGRCRGRPAAARSRRWRRRGARPAPGAGRRPARRRRARRRSRARSRGRGSRPRPRGSVGQRRGRARARLRPAARRRARRPRRTRTTSAPSSAARSAAARPATPPPTTSTSQWRRRYSVSHSRSFWRRAQPAEAGGAAQHPLVERPEPARADEGLVVEAGRREAAAEAVGRRHHVEVERGPGVLVLDAACPRRSGSPQARTPGRAVDVDQRVRALRRSRRSRPAAGGT